MGEFDDLRASLSERRADREAARVEALLAGEAVIGLGRRLEALRRTAVEDDPALAALEEEHEEAVAARSGARRRLAATIAEEATALGRITPFTDPVTEVGRLDDRTPVLLLPLRLETRFKPSPAGAPQLWVRVYPDACLVDGFEESLSASEVQNGTAFWAAVWRAGGDDGLERAAWRELVSAAGAGRAGWIVRTLLPKNPGDKPQPADATLDLIVVATGPQPAAVGAY